LTGDDDVKTDEDDDADVGLLITTSFAHLSSKSLTWMKTQSPANNFLFAMMTKISAIYIHDMPKNNMVQYNTIQYKLISVID